MGKTSNASKKAYNAKAYDIFKVVVYKGQKEIIQQYVKEKGMSLNGYINKLIAADMGERLTNPSHEE